MKRKKILNNKGFTMVELLAVVVILGILSVVSVAAVQGIISKAKERYYKSQEDNFVMAAQSYLNNNKKKQPRVSGQSVEVYLNELRSSKYIDKIVDYQKKECKGDKSFVKVFKYENDVHYTPYIECPNYTTDLNQYTSNIDIDTEFAGDGEHLNVAEATIKILDNNVKNKDGATADVPHGIVSYQYRIYVDGKIKYTSDVFNAKKIDSVTKTISLTEYVPGTIKINVTATNMFGLSKTESFTNSYNDNTPPRCGNITGDSTEWATGTRTISVQCDDQNGSGCKEDKFTYQFKGDVKVGNIIIEDKAGKKTKCPVNVYLDNNPPVLELKVYKKKAGSDEKADNKVVNTIKTSNSSKTVELTVDKDNVGGWLNKAKYPNGVYLEVNYDDISSTSSIEIKWNDTKQPRKKSIAGLLRLIKKIKPTLKKGNTNTTLVDEGYRQGQIIATDKFGHVSTINVNIPMDRTAPTYSKSGDSTSWTRNDRTVTVNCIDDLSGCASNPGARTYNKTLKIQKYTLTDNAGNQMSFNANIYVDKTAPACGSIEGASTSWTKNDRTVKIGCSDSDSGCSLTKFEKNFNSSTKVGTIQIKDKVGNTKDCNVNAYVDKTAPSCGTITGASTSWSKGNRTIKAKCNDGQSGCEKSEFQSTFSSNAKTSNITIKDKVGWTTNCPVNVYIDKSAPSCGSVSGASRSWTNGDRTITVNCNDSGGSGCSSQSKRFTSTTRTANITIQDGAGNSKNCPVDVYIDKTAPSCNGAWGESTSWSRGDRTVSVGCSDSDSGCQQGSFSRYFNWTLTRDNITIYDHAGNSRNCGVNVYLDNNPPSVWTTDGPRAQRCGGKAGLTTTYEVREWESGLAYVGDWWGWDGSFDGGNALNRNVGWGSNSFTKVHNWSASCTVRNRPSASYCYNIKVLARDIAGNEAHFVSPGCSYRG